MSSKMGNNDDYQFVGRCAGRISSWAREVERCHQLGVATGQHREPWRFDFHLLAVEIYFETLPLNYQLNLAAAYKACASAMRKRHVPDDLLEDWSIMDHYLRSASRAVALHPLAGDGELRNQTNEVETTVPGLVHFEGLAALVHPTGVSRLRSAAERVHVYCKSEPDRPRPRDDLIQVLQGLLDGIPLVDLAAAAGCSDRTLYRRLSRLRKDVGVTTTRELLAIGWELEWLPAPRKKLDKPEA